MKNTRMSAGIYGILIAGFLSVLALVPQQSSATAYDPGFADLLFCTDDVGGGDAIVTMHYEMIDTSGIYYGRPGNRIYTALGGAMYVSFNPDTTLYGYTGVKSECQHNMAGLATTSKAFFYSETSTTTSTTTDSVMEIRNPTQDLFYGLFLLLGLFGATVFVMTKRKEV